MARTDGKSFERSERRARSARALFVTAWLLILLSLLLDEASTTVSGVAGVAAGLLLLAFAFSGASDLAQVETPGQRRAVVAILAGVGVLTVAWGAANLA